MEIKNIDFMKFDTQGTEYDILYASKEILERPIIGIQTEIAFGEIYKNQKLFSDIDLLLRNYNFILFDLKRIF